MAGGRKANTVASGIWARNAPLSAVESSLADSPGPSRSSHGASETKKKAL